MKIFSTNRMFPLLQLWGINKKSFPQVPGFLACLQSIEIFLLDSFFFPLFASSIQDLLHFNGLFNSFLSLSSIYYMYHIYKMNKVCSLSLSSDLALQPKRKTNNRNRRRLNSTKTWMCKSVSAPYLQPHTKEWKFSFSSHISH